MATLNKPIHPEAESETVPKCDLNAHLLIECPEREFSCKYCNFKATHKIVTEQHLDVCTYYILKCPNGCGVAFERGDLEDHKKMCSLETVECEFNYTGCKDEFIRDKQQEHMELNTQKHLTLMAMALKCQQQKLLDLQTQEAQERNSQSQQHTLEDQNTQQLDTPDAKPHNESEKNENRAERTKHMHQKEKQKIKLVGVVSQQELRSHYIINLLHQTNTYTSNSTDSIGNFVSLSSAKHHCY